MIVLDIVVALLVFFFAYKGYKNGLIKELGSLLALIAGVFLAIRFSDFVATLIENNSDIEPEYISIISFAVIFIAVVVVVLMFAKLLDRFVKVIKLQWLNKVAGVVFATLKTVLIIGGLFFLVLQLNAKPQLIPEENFNNSFLFKPFIQAFELMFPYLEHLTIT